MNNTLHAYWARPPEESSWVGPQALVLLGTIFLFNCGERELPAFDDMKRNCNELVYAVVYDEEEHSGVTSLAYESSTGGEKYGKDAIAVLLPKGEKAYEYQIEFMPDGMLNVRKHIRFTGTVKSSYFNRLREDFSCLWDSNGHLQRAILRREGDYVEDFGRIVPGVKGAYVRDTDAYPLSGYSKFPEMLQEEATYRCDGLRISTARACSDAL